MKTKFSAVLPNGEVITRCSESHHYQFVVVGLVNADAGSCSHPFVLGLMAQSGGQWSVLGWRAKSDDATALANSERGKRYILKSHYLKHGRTRNSRHAVQVVDEYGPDFFSQVLVLPVATQG